MGIESLFLKICTYMYYFVKMYKYIFIKNPHQVLFF